MTAAFVVKSEHVAFGSVNVFADVVGPVKVVNPFAVPPLALGKIPVTFAVKSIVDAAIFAFVIARFATVKAPVLVIVASPDIALNVGALPLP